MPGKEAAQYLYNADQGERTSTCTYTEVSGERVQSITCSSHVTKRPSAVYLFLYYWGSRMSTFVGGVRCSASVHDAGSTALHRFHVNRLQSRVATRTASRRSPVI